MVATPEGTQIGVDGIRRPIEELPDNPASDYHTTLVRVVGAIEDGEVPSFDSETGTFEPSAGGGSGTPADGSVTNSKLADMAATLLKGRLTGTGPPQDLTPEQVVGILFDQLVDQLDPEFPDLVNSDYLSWVPDGDDLRGDVAVSTDTGMGGGGASNLLIPSQAAAKGYTDFITSVALVAARGLWSGETTADVSVNNTTTLVNANPSSGPGLNIQNLPVGNYRLWGLIPYWVSNNAFLKIDFTMTSGAATMIWGSRSLYPASVSGGAQNLDGRRRIISENVAFGGQGNPAVATDDLLANPEGRLKVTSAGTLQMRFAQNVNQANDCTIMSGAALYAVPIPS